MTRADFVANLRPDVRLNGARLPEKVAEDLRSLVVERELNLPARAVLTFTDPTHEHAGGTNFDIGSEIEVYGTAAEGDRRSSTRLFHGAVTGASVRRSGGGYAEFQIVADDPAVVLGRVVKPRAMVQYTAADVINELLKEHRITGDVASTSQKFDHLLQTVTSQYLIDEMCRRAGLAWWFDPVDKKFRVRPFESLTRSGANTVTLSQDLDEYELSATSLHEGSTSARGWDDTSKVSAVGTASSAGVTTDSPFLAKFLDEGAKKLDGARVGTTVERSDQTTAGLDVLAKTDLSAQLRRSVVAHVTVDISPTIGPASLVTVAVAPKPVRGKYLVTGVVHEFDGERFTTRFTTADFGAPLFAAGGQADAHAFTVPTLQVALVTNLKDPERRGRVKLRFPALADSLESTWARVAIVGGGGDRGLVWLPEVNDEVVVGFEGGDARRPVVLGCVFNGKDKFPTDTTTDGAHDIRRITSKAGNVVEFGDKNGSERILVSAKAGKATVEVAATGITVDGLANPVTIKNSGGASIVLDKQGGITLKGTKITVESQGEATLKAGAKVSVSGAVAEVASNGPLTVKGGVTEVSSSAVLALKGAMVKVN